MISKQYIRKYLRSFALAAAIIGLGCGAIQLSAAVMGPQPPQAEQAFKISDEELKMLNLDDSEAQELKQFFDALSILTPTQTEELA